jgi:hypothetical protein
MTTRMVVAILRTYCPRPTAIPRAAATQMDEAVVRPLTLPSANRMAPAPRKPTPVTILEPPGTLLYPYTLPRES